jgi:hypothetical protein
MARVKVEQIKGWVLRKLHNRQPGSCVKDSVDLEAGARHQHVLALLAAHGAVALDVAC